MSISADNVTAVVLSGQCLSPHLEGNLGHQQSHTCSQGFYKHTLLHFEDIWSQSGKGGNFRSHFFYEKL